MNHLLSFTKSERGKDILIHNCFLYHYCKACDNGDLYYKCVENRTTHKCKVTLNLDPGKSFVKKQPVGLHSHPVPSIQVPIIKRLRHQIKERVKSDLRSKAQALYTEEIGRSLREDGLKINSDTAQLIPSYKNMHKTLWNIKHKETPKQPVTTDDINLLNDKYNLTNEGKRYKLHDTLDEQRMIIYSSSIGLEIFLKVKNGTLMEHFDVRRVSISKCILFTAGIKAICIYALKFFFH